MCSVSTAVASLATIAGVGAVKKKQAEEQEAAYRAGQSSGSVTQDGDWGWWNQPKASQGVNSKYRLNKDSITSRLLATKGTSQLRSNSNKKPKTTGKDANKKRLTV